MAAKKFIPGPYTLRERANEFGVSGGDSAADIAVFYVHAHVSREVALAHARLFMTLLRRRATAFRQKAKAKVKTLKRRTSMECVGGVCPIVRPKVKP